MKTKRIFVIAVLLALLFLPSCSLFSRKGNDPEIPVTPAPVYRVGLLLMGDEDSPYSRNIIDSLASVCEDTGAEYIVRAGLAESDDLPEAVGSLISDGCGFIFGDSPEYEDTLVALAKDHEDIMFCTAGGEKAATAELPNYHNAYARIFEGWYLSGIAAGAKLNEIQADELFEDEDVRLGFVGRFQDAESISAASAFLLGARTVSPAAELNLTFTDTGYDPNVDKERVLDLIESGARIIAGNIYSHELVQTCTDAGIFFVSDGMDYLVEAPEYYLSGCRIVWEPYFMEVIDAMKTNDTIQADWCGTMEDGSVDITELNKNLINDDVYQLIAETADALLHRDIFVFDSFTYTVDGELMKEYFADVDPDSKNDHETEAIIGFVFRECEFRSAPYFDILIDGMNVLDNAEQNGGTVSNRLEGSR